MASGVVNLRLSEPLLAEYGAGLIGGGSYFVKSRAVSSLASSYRTVPFCFVLLFLFLNLRLFSVLTVRSNKLPTITTIPLC